MAAAVEVMRSWAGHVVTLIQEGPNHNDSKPHSSATAHIVLVYIERPSFRCGLQLIKFYCNYYFTWCHNKIMLFCNCETASSVCILSYFVVYDAISSLYAYSIDALIRWPIEYADKTCRLIIIGNKIVPQNSLKTFNYIIIKCFPKFTRGSFHLSVWIKLLNNRWSVQYTCRCQLHTIYYVCLLLACARDMLYFHHHNK